MGTLRRICFLLNFAVNVVFFHHVFSLEELLVMSPDHFTIRCSLVLLRLSPLRQLFLAIRQYCL